jgi:hypothetical protein
VYIYGIDLADPANISFTMDNTNKSFHYYNGTQQFVFDALFFSAQNLAQGAKHTFSWVINESKTNGTTGLFDYAVVTVEESAAPSCVCLRLYLVSPPEFSAGAAPFLARKAQTQREYLPCRPSLPRIDV